MEIINRIRDSFAEKMIINDMQIEIGIALGSTTFSENKEDLDTMIKLADTLMYQDKMRYKQIKYNSMDKED